MIRCVGQKKGVLRGNGDPALFGGNAGRSVRFGFSAEKMELFRDRIISAGEEGIASQNPFDSKKPAPQYAEATDRLERVRGAGWIKPAVGRRIWTDTSLIKPDQGQTQPLEGIFHRAFSSVRAASACCGSIMEPSWFFITARTSCIFTSPVAPRATNTMSYP